MQSTSACMWLPTWHMPAVDVCRDYILYMYPRSCIYRGLHWFGLVPRLLPNSEHPLLQEIWIWTVHVSHFYKFFLVQFRVWRPVTYNTLSQSRLSPRKNCYAKMILWEKRRWIINVFPHFPILRAILSNGKNCLFYIVRYLMKLYWFVRTLCESLCPFVA